MFAVILAVAGFFYTPEGGGVPETPAAVAQAPAVAKPANIVWPRKNNPLHAVVVFTRFKGEEPAESVPPSWSNDIFSGQLGSVNDYFRAISFGQFKVTGEVLPKVYELPADTTYYRNSEIYTRDVIRMLDEDPDFSFARYDNDGPDGIPNSGDDDGYADYIVLMPRTRPYNFIYRLATGVMNLNLPDEYVTSERKPGQGLIKVDKYSGCIAVAQNRTNGIGTLVAEIGHAFGAVDLMDKTYDTNETDSAGVGYWCMLGWGANGWGDNGVPVGPCAYNRMQMNSIGVNNVNLVDIYGILQGVRIKDVGEPDGKVYRIWVAKDEYFLIEYRNNAGNLFYDSFLPKSGLLIWHINEHESNSTEESKLCDLECPDGRYKDAGYPKGEFPDPVNGRDNLDFWAHDNSYTLAHAGNRGDATDVYDGDTYTTFGTKTNPSSNSSHLNFITGIEIFNIRKFGHEMMFDCFIPPIPTKQPIKAPSVGLAYQRSNGTRIEDYLDFRKALYLMNFGLTSLPSLLVTVSRDTIYAQDVTSLNQYLLQKTVAERLGTLDDGNGMIVRENVSLTEFRRMVADYGITPETLGGGREITSIQKVFLDTGGATLPTVIRIEQNYPNPFNGSTFIPYTLSKNSPVTVEVFDILGRKVADLDQGYRGRGTHAARFEGGNFPSGVYFYRIRGSVISQTRRFVILK